VNPEELERRLADIEVKLSFAENLVDELNGVVYRQQQQIDALQEALRRLRDQVEANAPAEPRNLRDEIPPHY
jgi:SlyX protein